MVLVTCSVHANEIGATQMSLELVHQLATDDSPAVKKILDNVIFLLVPSANPDGQILVTDWFNKNLGTPYETSPLPYLYHPYAGHDINRDMYMFTQKESQYMAQLVWHDWFPTVWLDEHQMGNNGPRMFVMPAADPINPNVHPLIYRWNGILGQSQAAALEAAGKDGIIYNSTYTNFWEGAMAWSGWWHNQIGLLTEVASVRVAAPIDQQRATPTSVAQPADSSYRDAADSQLETGVLGPPTDITPRTDYPRPWMGGRWTLRDIVDYELIATMALLETAADRRETILRQIYEVNRQTVENSWHDDIATIVVPMEKQHDVREVAHLVDRLDRGGVEVYRVSAAFALDGRQYGAGTFVIPMTQVFARYAKDLLEKQTYPEIQRAPNAPPEAAVRRDRLVARHAARRERGFPPARRCRPRFKMTRVTGSAENRWRCRRQRAAFGFDYDGSDTAIAINRVLKEGGRVAFDKPSHVSVAGVSREKMEGIAKDFGLVVVAGDTPGDENRESRRFIRRRASALCARGPAATSTKAGRAGSSSNTSSTSRSSTTPNCGPAASASGSTRSFCRTRALARFSRAMTPRRFGPEYRGGIGEQGLDNLKRFIADGGTVVMLGSASDLAIDRLQLPVRDLKRGLRREQHFAPGTILRIQVDTSQPIGFGMAADTYGFYNNSPFFLLIDGSGDPKPTVVARYPTQECSRLRVAERRGADGRTRGGRLGRHESGARRALRPAAAASRADARHVPDALFASPTLPSLGTR